MNALRVTAVLLGLTGPALVQAAPPAPPQQEHHMDRMDDAKFKDWEALWEKDIIGDEKNRYCDKDLGEEIGWEMYPFTQGFYYGYLATGDTKWIDREFDWLDSLIKREVIEPDGYPGWPKLKAAGTDVDELNTYDADSMLGEAMVFRSAMLMSAEILRTPALKEKYGAKAESYIKLSGQLYEKWDKRGAWRDTDGIGMKGVGMISVVLPFGIDTKTGKWTDGYATRNAPGHGFSHPENKANLVACWLLAMFDATQKPVYRDRAEKWFTLLKSRMMLKDDGTYEIWNYWQPAGPWDYKPDVSRKHWVGVHPNAGYYEIDLDGIVTAYQHGLVFTRDDIGYLIKTAIATKRYWQALVPYDSTIQQHFEETLKPNSWGGHEAAAWYLALQQPLRHVP